MQICQNFTDNKNDWTQWVYAKRRIETQFQTKKIDAEYFDNIVWRDFAR